MISDIQFSYLLLHLADVSSLEDILICVIIMNYQKKQFLEMTFSSSGLVPKSRSLFQHASYALELSCVASISSHSDSKQKIFPAVIENVNPKQNESCY